MIIPAFNTSFFRTTSFNQNTHTVNVSSNSKVSTLTVPQGLGVTQTVQNLQRTQQNNLPYFNTFYNLQNQTRVRNFY